MPASAVPLDTLLQRADLWRGGHCARPAGSAVASGYPALDAALPDGGWPRGSLTEILSPTLGGGELSLFLPALRSLDAPAGWIVLVAPPAELHAPAWQHHGLPLSRLIVVHATDVDAAWACEQLLASGAVAALLAWLPTADVRSLRRLQLASTATRSLSLIFRPPSVAAQASPAPLRVAVRGTTDGVQVELLKRRGPPLCAPLMLAIERPLAWSRLHPRVYTPAPQHGEFHAA